MSLESTTALGLYVLAFVERTEDPIGKWLIGEQPLQGDVSLFHQVTLALAYGFRFALLSDPDLQLQGVAAVLLAIAAPGAGFKVYLAIFGLANAGRALTAPISQEQMLFVMFEKDRPAEKRDQKKSAYLYIFYK